MKRAFSFDDVLLKPKYSDIESRGEVDLTSSLSEGVKLKLPVISSPMDTVTETSMAVAMGCSGGLGIIHRYSTIERQCEMVKDCYYSGAANVAAAVGMTGDFLTRAQELVRAGANILCIDVAHGHHSMM